MNLLQETLDVMTKHNKTPNDVKWVGVCYELTDSPFSRQSGYYTWDEFEKQSHSIVYSDDYGSPEINEALVVVGKDWWLERHEYDDAEWWEYKTTPMKPNNKVGKLSIVNE